MKRIITIVVLAVVLLIVTTANSCTAPSPAEIIPPTIELSVKPIPPITDTYPLRRVHKTSQNVTNPAETVNEPAIFVNEDAATFSEDELEMLAKTVWGEAGVCSPEEQVLVVWTILQRLEDERFPDTLEEVITQSGQFCSYDSENPVYDEILTLCKSELTQWEDGAEPPTLEPYAPTAPYYFFDGDKTGLHNWFREEWETE